MLRDYIPRKNTVKVIVWDGKPSSFETIDRMSKQTITRVTPMLLTLEQPGQSLRRIPKGSIIAFHTSGKIDVYEGAQGRKMFEKEYTLALHEIPRDSDLWPTEEANDAK